MRRQPVRVLVAVAVTACTVGGLAACSDLGETTFEDEAKVSQKVSSIRLDSANGGVRIEASAETSTVSVHREINYRGDKPDGVSFRVENGVLTLSGCGEKCGVNYEVKVPAGLPVAGGTTNGGLTLSGVGAVDVHTSNGAIAVNGATGPVKLRTSNGDVKVKGAKGGGIDTQTTNGAVTIQTATAQNIKARTTSGGLTVTVPPAKYRISAEASNGDKDVAFRNDPSGTYRLDLSTTNGSLTVKSAG
ncbi:DUF4097 family beta strand repeat-containing protein [Streptomyces sp. NBC_01304]|uniref:DUF4097 family beta strand repeat-containing protein n=1 Tax=Streptomyces sp. NBC_01304 TaxID=2903818 RepID=UPI002E15E473|nr:DUF4097 family beta strand repeat-containing protein [Streptomyces sp. NBC_01304]